MDYFLHLRTEATSQSFSIVFWLVLFYQRRLNDYYEKWITNYKDGRLLVIDVDQVNFAEDEEAQGEVINKVNAELYGLF